MFDLTTTSLLKPNDSSDNMTKLRRDMPLKVGRYRKVRNTLFQRTSAISYEGPVDASMTVINRLALAAGLTAGVVGGLVLTGVVSATAGAAVIFLGIPMAVILGIAAVLLLVYEVSTNRETNHNIVTKYVWSMVDNKRPEFHMSRDAKANKEIASAATYLIQHSDSQLKVLRAKIEGRAATAQAFCDKYMQVVGVIKAMDISHSELMEKSVSELEGTLIYLKNRAAYADEVWAHGAEKGGVLHEYVRRLQHASNYLQLGTIINYVLLNTIDNTVPAPHEHDPFEGSTEIIKIRKGLCDVCVLHENFHLDLNILKRKIGEALRQAYLRDLLDKRKTFVRQSNSRDLVDKRKTFVRQSNSKDLLDKRKTFVRQPNSRDLT